MEFKRDDPKEVVKKIVMYEKYVEFLKKFKTGLEEFSDVSYFDDTVEDEINGVVAKKDTYFKEQNCQHIKTTGMQYEGHDSHHDYYEDKCLTCGVILKSDWT